MNDEERKEINQLYEKYGMLQNSYLVRSGRNPWDLVLRPAASEFQQKRPLKRKRRK